MEEVDNELVDFLAESLFEMIEEEIKKRSLQTQDHELS